MERFIALTTTLAVLPFVVQARDVYYQGNLTPLNITPTFDKGYLAVYEPEHAVSLYRPDGSLAEKVTPQVPHAAWTNVVNASPDADGSLALAVEYRIDHLGGGGVTVFDPTGSQTAFIGTGADYWPAQVCFGPDQSIWAIGWRDRNASAANSHYQISALPPHSALRSLASGPLLLLLAASRNKSNSARTRFVLSRRTDF